jgi:LuxR family maltose regulon positive regulatory protein
METALLQTKFYIPPSRPVLVSRPRLVETLNTGLQRKLTLISAPAGFGKTTLVSEWLASCEQPAAWLSLDEEDNDLARFLAYLVGALQVLPSLCEAGVGESALAMLHASRPQPPPVGAILTALINESAAVSTAFILILDDYHLIQAQPIHNALTFLIDHQPPSMHLVLATRADPPLPLARLRGRGQLTELRQTDLRFTNAEAAEFLNQVMGLNLSAEDIIALDTRTEGWIVGLQLAALSLQGRTDLHDFITAFSGGHHYILEYLVEEVVRRQPEPIQRFLIQTSILDRLCGPLCDAVRFGESPSATGDSTGEAMLAYLQQHNLFIIPLDDEHQWYRYHHLFADLLGNLLRKRQPLEHIQQLHSRACAWYDQNGLAAKAVSHALAAEDFERAAQLIERYSLAMVARGELTTLLRWIDALPQDIARGRPWLCLHQAWPLTFAGRTAAVESLLRQIEDHVSLDSSVSDSKAILGNVAAMRAMLTTMHGDMSRAVELAHQADALLPADSWDQRTIIPFVLASAYYAQGELAKANQALTEKLEMGRTSGNLWAVVRSLCDLADLRIMRGRLGEAGTLVQEALQQAEARGARQFGTVGYVLVKLSELLYEHNDLRTAQDHVQEGLHLMQGWQQPYEMVSGYTMLAAICQAQKDARCTLEALRNAEKIQAQHPHYDKLTRMVNLCRIRLGLAQNEPENAARQATTIQLGEATPSVFREQEQIVLARVLIAQQKWDEALSLLLQLAKDAESGQRFGHLVEILALQAITRGLLGDTVQALSALEQAFVIGEPEGYVRVFVDLGAPMADLLQHAAAQGIAPNYAHKLLAAFGTDETESIAAEAPFSGASSLVEPLTDRELEVLRLLGNGYANQDIAEALFITLNTVKKHASGIYSKLGVHSRTQAVVRAQELGLL